MGSRLTRYARRVSLLFALLLALAALPVSLPPPARAAGAVTVAASTAAPDFPQHIAFHLEASAQGAEIARVALLYHPVATPTVERIAIPTERGSHVALDYALDTQDHYLPPGIDVEYRWLLALSDGTETRTSPVTFRYMDGREQWTQVTSGPVTLWWDGSDAHIGQDAADTAARTISRLSGTFHVPGDRPVRILLYTNQRDMLAGLPPNSATWLGGSSTPALDLVQAVVDPTESGAESAPAAQIRRVIPHEVSRLITYRASENPYNTLPTWLDEGVATANQETPDLRLRPLLFDAATGGTLIPLRALDAPFPLDPNRALLSYAESESVVGYITNAYKPGTLPALVAAFKDGLSYDEATQRVLKEGIDALDADWKASLNYGGDQGGITG
ncbi:MAG: peptidase MA family metallohydrolase [Thermomicrobiales bacterium]